MATMIDDERIPECRTQDGLMPPLVRPPPQNNHSSPSGTSSIKVGWFGMIPRWEVKSKPAVLRYHLEKHTFRKEAEAHSISTLLTAAIKLWNDVNCGVRFEHTHHPAHAHFKVVYAGAGNGETAAQSFFPDEIKDLKIFAPAFDDPIFNTQMLNTLTHELGHILGLRHEQATKEGESINTFSVGSPNPDSIMGYQRSTRKLQESDKEGLKLFYQLPVGLRIGDVAVTDFPVKA